MTPRFSPRILACSFVLLALAPACGGDDDGGGSTGLDSGLDTSKPGVELTPDDQVRLCEAFHEFASQSVAAREDDVVRSSCTVLAAFTSADVAACEERVDECVDMMDESPGTTEISPVSCEPTAGTFDDCTATVGEIEACMKDSVTAGLDVVLGLDCETLFQTSVPPSAAAQNPPSCEAITQTCPALFEKTATDGPAVGS